FASVSALRSADSSGLGAGASAILIGADTPCSSGMPVGAGRGRTGAHTSIRSLKCTTSTRAAGRQKRTNCTSDRKLSVLHLEKGTRRHARSIEAAVAAVIANSHRYV